MELTIKNIAENELEDFLAILREAALWLKNAGKEMWNDREFSPANLLKYNTIEELFIAYIDKEAAAVMILQEEDRTFWPDSGNDSLFLHKLAVRRKYASKGLSKDMVHWAKERAKSLKKTYLRLDCAADRPKLCSFYEMQGFRKVSERVMFGIFPTAFYEAEIE